MIRFFIAITAVLFTTVSSAQQLAPLPADLSTVPTLGIDKTGAMKILDQSMEFVGLKQPNGLERFSGTPDGKTTVVFTCVGNQVVAASITLPMMGAQPAEQDAVKVVTLLRMLMNLRPEVDWTPYPFGQVFLELKKPENERWIATVDGLQLTAARAQPGFIVIRLVNEQAVSQLNNLGDF